MFDSEIVPLVTRVVAGDGIILSYNVNSDQEAVYTASIDPVYITSNIQSSFDQDALDRLAAIEARLGITSSNGGASPSETTNTVVIAADNATTVVDTTINWSIQSVDGDNIISRSFVLSAGTLLSTGMRLIARSVTSDTSASKYVSSFTASDTTGTFVWNSGFDDFSFTISAGSTADNVTFTVTQ